MLLSRGNRLPALLRQDQLGNRFHEGDEAACTGCRLVLPVLRFYVSNTSNFLIDEGIKTIHQTAVCGISIVVPQPRIKPLRAVKAATSSVNVFWVIALTA